MDALPLTACIRGFNAAGSSLHRSLCAEPPSSDAQCPGGLLYGPHPQPRTSLRSSRLLWSGLSAPDQTLNSIGASEIAPSEIGDQTKRSRSEPFRSSPQPFEGSRDCARGLLRTRTLSRSPEVHEAHSSDDRNHVLVHCVGRSQTIRSTGESHFVIFCGI